MRPRARGSDVVDAYDWSNSVDLVLSIGSDTTTLSGDNVLERAGHQGATPGLVNAVGDARRNRTTIRRTGQQQQDLRLIQQDQERGLRSASLARAGTLAWEAFLRPPVSTTLLSVLAEADETNRAVRIGVEVGEFGWVPWEGLRDPDSTEPLALRSGLAIYRLSQGAQAPALPGPLRVLVAIAAPNDYETAVLDYESELLNLDAAISAARGTTAQLTTVNFATTDALRTVLEETPAHVLHITGHGTPGAVVLEDDAGRSRLVSAEELVAEAFPEGRMPPVLSLAACFTGAVTADGGMSFADKLIELGVSAVVATETSVTDIYAADFFAALYRILAHSATPDLVRAVAEARRATHFLITASNDARQARVAGLDEWSVVTVQSPSARFNVYDNSEAETPNASSRSRNMQANNEFIGRRREQRALVEMLNRPGCTGIAIQGIGGLGKTELMSHLVNHQLANQPHAVIDAADSVNEVLGVIGNAIRRYAEDHAEIGAIAETLTKLAGTVLDESRPLADRIDALHEPPAQNISLIIGVDHVSSARADSGESSDAVKLIAGFIATNPDWRFIFTCRNGSILTADARERLLRLSLGPLSRGESLKMMRSFDQLDQLSDAALNRIWSRVGGHPRSLQILDGLLSDSSWSSRNPDRSDETMSEVNLDEALTKTVGLAADELGVQELVQQLSPFEALLLLRMSVYREAVDITGLLYQTGDVNPDAPARRAVEPFSQIGEILRRYGVDLSALDLDLSSLSVEARSELAPHAAELIAALIPPVTPSEHAQSAVMKLADLSLVTQETVSGQLSVDRVVAAAVREMPSTTTGLMRDAHRRAAEYWLWRARAVSFELDSLLRSFREAHYHYLLAGDVDGAISVADTICDRLHQVGDRDAEAWFVNNALILLRNQPERQGFWLHRRGNLAYQRGDIDVAEADYRRAAEIHIANEDEANLAPQYGQLAIIARDRGDEEEAKRHFQKCLEIDERRGYNPGVARTAGHLGSMALAAGNFEEARSHFERSLSLREADGDYPGVAASCVKLAVLAQAENDLAGARDYLDRSLEIRRRLGLLVDMSDLLKQFGILALQHNNDVEARDWFREAYDVADRLGDGAALAGVLHQQALLAYEHGDLGEAKRLFEQSLAQIVRDPNNAERVRAKFILGYIAARSGDLDLAANLFLQVVESLNERTQSLQLADAEIELARIARAQSDPRGALIWLARAAGRQLESQHDRLSTETLEAMIELRLEVGAANFNELIETALARHPREQLRDRLSHHEEERIAASRSLAERLAAQTGSRLRDRLLGLLQSTESDSRAGRLADAISNLREAVSIARAITMQENGVAALGLAEALRNLATLVWNRENSMESIQLASEAAHLFGSIPATAFEENPFEIVAAQARSQWTLGIILAEVARDHQRGLDVTAEAVTMLRAAGEQTVRQRDELAIALHNLGTRLLEAGRTDDAFDVFSECLLLTEGLASGNDEQYAPRLASCLVNLATTYVMKGMPAEAKQAADRAVTIRRNEVSSVPSEERTRDLARSLQISAVAQLAAGESDTARDQLEEAVEAFRVVASSNPAAGAELEGARMQLAAINAGSGFQIPNGGAPLPDPTLRALDPSLAQCPTELLPALNKIEAAQALIIGGDFENSLRIADEADLDIATIGSVPNFQLDVARLTLLQTLAAHLDGVLDVSQATLLRHRALELLRINSEDWDLLKPVHANLAHELAAHHDRMSDTAAALPLAEEATEVLRRLVENPYPHHRFQHLPALVRHTVYLGELKLRTDNLAEAVRVLTEAVEMSRECLYSRRYLDGWADVVQAHVNGLLWLTTAFELHGELWAAVESSNDAVRIGRELAVRGAYLGTSVLSQALSRHARLATRVGRNAEAQASAGEAIQYLQTHAAEFDAYTKNAVAGDAHMAIGLALLADDQEASLLHLFRAAGSYRDLVDLTPHPFPLLTFLNLRVTIGNLLLDSGDRLHNAEVLTEFIETRGADLAGQMPPGLRQFFSDIASSDDPAWSAELRSRIKQVLENF
jgi:tetratricopeptide (TPR) repeat protein